MTLEPVNKATYRQRLNRVIIVFIAIFAVSSLVVGQLLISIFSQPDGDNFKFNLLGVITGLALTTALLAKAKYHPYMKEVYYVWQLKQIMNRIYRKLTKVKQLSSENDIDAIIILNYYYTLCEKIYQLDDNTITLSTLTAEHNSLKAQIDSLNLTINEEDFNETLLSKIS